MIPSLEGKCLRGLQAELGFQTRFYPHGLSLSSKCGHELLHSRAVITGFMGFVVLISVQIFWSPPTPMLCMQSGRNETFWPCAASGSEGPLRRGVCVLLLPSPILWFCWWRPLSLTAWRPTICFPSLETKAPFEF